MPIWGANSRSTERMLDEINGPLMATFFNFVNRQQIGPIKNPNLASNSFLRVVVLPFIVRGDNFCCPAAGGRLIGNRGGDRFEFVT